ncbi:hypothetical protein [Micromonospora sp. NPDC049497]|uniref:hypothetical protein n=1 Tax=Micromonospora sp. NPDC049497 TaxID=3364273 RepID=UPI0037BA83A9
MTVRRSLARGGVVLTALAIAYVAGVLPAPAGVTVDHCYVTYDRLERQHSRCVGHWTRAAFDFSGPVHDVELGTSWHALAGPDDNYEWEVEVPETARRHDGLTVLTHGWVVPPFAQALLTACAGAVLGGLCWMATTRLRRRG